MAGTDDLTSSLVDAATFLALNAVPLRAAGRSLVLYLPKIQTADEAALWGRVLDEVETTVVVASLATAQP